jgi:hypothetical protein
MNSWSVFSCFVYETQVINTLRSKSHDAVCVSDSSRKRQKVDTQSLLVRHVVCGHFNVRARVGA